MVAETQLGRFLPGLMERQNETAARAAGYIGVSDSYPTDVRFDRNLTGTGIAGYQTVDRYGITIGYNPEITDWPSHRRNSVADHEAVHVAQPGKENMLGIYINLDSGSGRMAFPLGRALVEGGAEYILEKIGRERASMAYEPFYRLARAVDRYVPLGDIYKAAEISPARACGMIERALQKPDVQSHILTAMLYSKN